MTGSIEPTSIDIEKTSAVTVTWADGEVSRFELEGLRLICPCAECRGAREAGAAPWPKPTSPQPIALVGAEMTGAWGMSITWNDGHSTGIYAWEQLRAWWDAGLSVEEG